MGHSVAPSVLINQSNASLVANLRYGLIFASCNKRSILVRRSDGVRPHLFAIAVGLGVVESATGGRDDDDDDDDDDDGAGVVGVGMIGRLVCLKRRVQN